MPLSAGQTFAGYRIVRLLGSGGMGEVYLAEHPRLPRRDALKILRGEFSADDEYQRRFIREADLAAGLWHPNIVRVNDRGECDGQLWISMDYVEGTDAASLLQDPYTGGMRPDDVASIMSAVASGLDYAHQRGLLHRDVKPANILLTEPHEGERRILLADFGIARTIADVSGLTATNIAMGTLPYAAPEQLMGEPIDGRADQYALAATAYHLLCGTPLFPLSNPAAVISRHLTSPPPTLAAQRPDLAGLDPVLSRALAKKPDDRFASCTNFASVFKTAADSHDESALAHTMPAPVIRQQTEGPSAANSGGPSSPRRRFYRWAIPIAAAILIAAGLGILANRQYLHIGAPPRPQAAVLDGTYEILINNEQRTFNGAPAPMTSSPMSPPPSTDSTPQSPAPAPPKSQAPDNIHVHAKWAYRSTCNPSGCVAEGVLLDADAPTKADKSGTTTEKHLIDGQWVTIPTKVLENYDQCAFEDGKRVPGSDTESVSSSWRPQPDGTFRGMWTETVLTDECHLQGKVTQVPITATRVADVPAGIAFPAPAALGPPPPTPAPPAPGQPALEGTYRLDFDAANDKVNGVVTPDKSPLKTEWWAFRSLCGSMGCVAAAVELDQDNNQVPTAVSDVLHLADGQWHSRPEVALVATCTVTRNGVTGPEQYPEDHIDKTWTPQPDGSLRGVETLSVTTDECGQQGRVTEFPFVATRVGAIPTSVIVADPGLFVS